MATSAARLTLVPNTGRSGPTYTLDQVLNLIREERLRQDAEHGRHPLTAGQWAGYISDYNGRVHKDANNEDANNLRFPDAVFAENFLVVAALAVAALELGFRPGGAAAQSSEELPAPGVDPDADPTDDPRWEKCTCTSPDAPDDACPVHGEMGGEG